MVFKCDNSGNGDRERTIIKTPVSLLLARMLTSGWINVVFGHRQSFY